jgi:very-short-patch-repair endonuclease
VVPATDPALKRERLRGFARQMRKDPTQAERRLWYILRDRQLAEHKFRRQQPIGPFIVDFVCYERQLIVEVDGSQHADDPSDTARDTELKRRGFRIVRVWNNELTNNKIGVLDAIVAALDEVAPPSSALRAPSPIEGEGHGTASTGGPI